MTRRSTCGELHRANSTKRVRLMKLALTGGEQRGECTLKVAGVLTLAAVLACVCTMPFRNSVHSQRHRRLTGDGEIPTVRELIQASNVAVVKTSGYKLTFRDMRADMESTELVLT